MYFLTKNNGSIKFEIYEEELSGIKTCKKYGKDKVIVLSNNYLSIIEILKDCEYLIIKKYPISFEAFDFNIKLDLIISVNNENYYNSKYNIYLLYYNKYDKELHLYNSNKI